MMMNFPRRQRPNEFRQRKLGMQYQPCLQLMHIWCDGDVEGLLSQRNQRMEIEVSTS